MSLDTDLSELDATAQALLVREGQVSPAELVDAAIERIERVNPAINAVVTPMYDLARKAALDALPDGPLAGVPFLLKDLGAAFAGVPMTGGAAVLRDFVPEYDSEMVIRLKRAGLIVVGKTNTPELGCHATTEPRLFGATRNPWDTSRIPGGSSGGSAAAVAARLVPAAHGSDGGGSIRIPASCCGVFGLKPTRARTPQGPDNGHPSSLLVVGHALTRSVRDSAALLDATCGPDVGDPYWAPPRERPYTDEIGADPGKLRISFSVQTLAGKQVHSDCVNAVREAADLCAQLGHEVTEAAPEIDGDHLKDQFLFAFSSLVASSIERLSRATGRTLTADDFEPATWTACERGRALSAADYLLAVGDLQLISRQMGLFLTTCDIWLTPTLAEPPVPLGSFDRTLQEYRELGDEQVLSFIPFTPICNVTGLPGMSVPLHWNAAGLPVGTHFVGRFGDEATLFRLAAQMEEARPWADRRPPVCA